MLEACLHNLNAKCEYHKGFVRHSIEDCRAFQAQVQELFEIKKLVFEEDNPDVKCEYHTRIVGNAIEECQSFKRKFHELIGEVP